jgi:hypothetical protein
MIEHQIYSFSFPESGGGGSGTGKVAVYAKLSFLGGNSFSGPGRLGEAWPRGPRVQCRDHLAVAVHI